MHLYFKGTPDCLCLGCHSRRTQGLTPLHLKHYDDTSEMEDEHQEGDIEDEFDGNGLKPFRIHLDLASCSPKELKYFIQSRKLQDPFPSGLTLKCYYIRVLEAADQEASFRFLDLTAELQNFVYCELLTLQTHRYGSDQRYCYPQILATCKKINTDAKDIIHAENTLICSFSTSLSRLGYRHLQINIHNQSHVSIWRSLHVGTINVSTIIKLCSQPANSMLQKMHALEIEISLDGMLDAYDDDKDGWMRTALFFFASFFERQARPEETEHCFRRFGVRRAF